MVLAKDFTTNNYANYIKICKIIDQIHLQFDGIGSGIKSKFSKICQESRTGLQILQLTLLHFLIYKIIKLEFI